jgi:predicted nucleotidyltransferase
MWHVATAGLIARAGSRQGVREKGTRRPGEGDKMTNIKHQASSLKPQASLLQQIVMALADLPGVAAIALGGSTAAGFADEFSDFDLYVYYHEPLAASADRAARLRTLADEGTLEVGIPTFGLEDHLRVQQKLVELVYLYLDRLIADVDHAYSQGLISEGYTTGLMYILFRNQIFHDATGEVTALHARLPGADADRAEARRSFIRAAHALQHPDDLLQPAVRAQPAVSSWRKAAAHSCATLRRSAARPYRALELHFAIGGR